MSTGNTDRLLNLVDSGKALRPRHNVGRAANSPPGRVVPARPFGNEVVLNAPRARQGLNAVMAADIGGLDKDVAFGVA